MEPFPKTYFSYVDNGHFRLTTNFDSKPREDKNNLYKGITQILSAMPEMKRNLANLPLNRAREGCGSQIIPLIITNAPIFTYDYNSKTKKAVEHGAIYGISAKEDNPEKIEYIFIVHIDKLKKFIEYMEI